MGKQKKFSDELLNDAVEKYHYEHTGKIKLSELAKWAQTNMPGLESVCPYDFSRKIQTTDHRTGKITEKERECTKKIKLYNNSLSEFSGKNNAILHSASIDKFFELSYSDQRNAIFDARKELSECIAKIEKEKIEKKILNTKLLETENSLATLSETIKQLKIVQKELYYRQKYCIKKIAEYEAKKLLIEAGFTDEHVDLAKLYNSTIAYADSFSLDAITSKYIQVQDSEELVYNSHSDTDSAENKKLDQLLIDAINEAENSTN